MGQSFTRDNSGLMGSLRPSSKSLFPRLYSKLDEVPHSLNRPSVFQVAMIFPRAPRTGSYDPRIIEPGVIKHGAVPLTVLPSNRGSKKF
jgi:hypothetical protein